MSDVKGPDRPQGDKEVGEGLKQKEPVGSRF